MLSLEQVQLRLRIEAKTLHLWIEEGWLIPRVEEANLTFSELDIARAQLILDLKRNLGVNDEGVGIILNLLDQVHGLRRTMREVLGTRIDQKPGSQD